MLVPPSKGFARSVKTHNVGIDALAEWIEGCVTFDEDVVSESAVVDLLVEEHIYQVQDFARERLQDALLELDRRRQCLGTISTFSVNAHHVLRVKLWQDSPAYAFCLMLALQASYRPHFVKMFGHDYTEQGVLFERLTIEAVAQMGWRTHATGWSKQAAASITDKVQAVATHLGEYLRPESVARWTDQDAKDGGLDIVCHIPFADGWAGRPLYYLQCASGEGWMAKRSTPILALWEKLIDVATKPRRGVSIPFALLADDFRKAANYDDLSLLIDRHRVCAPVLPIAADWVSAQLAADLNAWTNSRLVALQAAKA